MKLSIVTTLYRSSPYVAEFCERSCKIANSVVGDDFELILVNDGSPDESCDVALALSERIEQITVIDLARNFGHHKAMMTGLLHSVGDRVFLIDSDLEEPPEVLLDWWNALDSEPGLDVVYGVQATRKGGWFERISGAAFYWLMNHISPVSIPANAVTARLMTRRYVEALTQHMDREVFMLGLWSITGFCQKGVAITKGCRGISSYTFRKRLALFANAITSFSTYPLHMIFFVGSGIAMVGFTYAVSAVVWKVIHPNEVMSGWTSIVASVWLVGGANLMALGVIGVYVAKVFSETKQRPYTVVRNIYRRHQLKRVRQ